MPKFIWISPIIFSIVVLSFGVNVAEPETSDTLQVLKKETAHSVRSWPWASTAYKDFELSSCTLSFRTMTLPRGGENYAARYPPQIYKYSFPLQSIDVRLEWLATYDSYVLSLSGPGSLTIEEGTPSLLFATKVKRNWPAPNISIPFENEDSAKRARSALQDAIDGCRGKKDPVQKMNVTASPVREELSADVNAEKYAIKVNVDLVTADVTVIGDNAPELKAEDFIIYDNKIAQEISYFSNDLPISVALVLQSGIVGAGRPEVSIDALSALRLLNPEDQIALYSLDGDRPGNLTDDRVLMAKLISFLGSNQGYQFNMFGTLYDAARYLKQEASGRRAIVLMCENTDDRIRTSSGVLGRDTLDVIEKTRIELLESATTLYSLTSDYFEKFKTMEGGRTNRTIKSIVEDTGGETVVYAFDRRSVTPISGLRHVIDRMRTQYTLGFTPSNPGERGSFHELTVILANENRCPKCRIKARRGYYPGVAAHLLPVPKPQAKPLQSLSEIDNKLIQEIMFLAGTSYFDLNDISFAIRNAEKITSRSGQNQMMIDLSIDPAGIDTVTSEGRRTYRIQAAMFYSDKEGNLLGSNVWKIEGSLGEENFNRVSQKGIPFSAKIPVIADDQILRIVLYDEIGGRMGSKFTKKKGKGLAIVKQPLAYPGPINPRILAPGPGQAIGSSGQSINPDPALRR